MGSTPAGARVADFTHVAAWAGVVHAAFAVARRIVFIVTGIMPEAVTSVGV